MSERDLSIDTLVRGYVNSYIRFYNTHSIVGAENLAEFQSLLVSMEEATRTENFPAIYEAATKIAEMMDRFENGKECLAYYTNALEAATHIVKHGSEFTARCNLALALRKYGQILESLEEFEKAYELVKIQQSSDSISKCVLYLLDTHYILAVDLEKQGNKEEALAHHQIALDLVKTDDPELTGKEAPRFLFNVARLSMHTGKVENSVSLFEKFLDSCAKLQLQENVGVGQLLLSQCHELLGKSELATSNLIEFISNIQNHPEQQSDLIMAHKQLGLLYFKLKKYELASQQFEMQYKLLKQSQIASSEAQLRSAIVQLGITRANEKLSYFVETCTANDGLSALLNWKSINDFGDYVPPSRRV